VLPDYGDFVTGLYGKIRNNTAKIRSIYNDYNIVSCCITVTDNINTIINAVGTDKNYRNKDYAKTLIYNMSGKNTYLYCNDDIHTVIYEKMGFKIVGKWKEIYR
jgi:predicted GNAT family acetyltransferase